MIFGSDGKTINKIGDSYYTKDGCVNKYGNTYFGPNGQNANEIGDTLHTIHGTVHTIGDTLYAPNGSYHMIGSTLYGPNGKLWNGVNSMEDARAVIMSELASSQAEKNVVDGQFSSAPLIPWDNSDKEPINLSTGATLALISLIGIGALLLIIFL